MIMEQFIEKWAGKDWIRKLERDIVRACYNKSSNSNEASEK